MSQSQIRVIRIIARLNVGGPAKHVAWLTSSLTPPEFASTLVAGTVPPGEEDMGYFAAELGVRAKFIPEMSREISPKDLVTIWKLFRLFRTERPNIIHTHTAKAGTVGRIAGFCYRWLTPRALVGQPVRCKFVHTYHGHIFHSYYGKTKTRFFVFIERLLARAVTDRILVISEQQRKEINQDFGVGRAAQFRVVPLGLDLDEFKKWRTSGKDFRSEIGVESGTTLVGIVGRLTEIKNHELFLHAVAELKALAPEDAKVKFVIIGDGALRGSLEALAKSLRVSSDIIFAGSRRDPGEFYPALDAVALTSRNEGTPLTLIEAMACARPVIATKVGGVIDLLGAPVARDEDVEQYQRGIGVEPGDARAFAAGMLRLVQSEKLRQELGLKGLEFVERNYRKERLIEDVKGLYRDLLAETPAASYSGAK